MSTTCRRVRRSTSPHRSCCGCAPISPARPAWTTGRARTRRSSPPRRVSRSTGRSTLPRTTRACGRRPTGVETAIPADRKIDGVAEVTFHSVLSPLLGRKQTSWPSRTRSTCSGARCSTLARRTRPAGTRSQARKRRSAARAWSTSGRRDGVGAGEFRKFINEQLAPALAGTGVLKELRTQTFLPWIEKLWDTPERRARQPRTTSSSTPRSCSGSPTPRHGDAFFDQQRDRGPVQTELAPLASAIHAYDVAAALTYVKNGAILPHYEQ